MSKMLKSKQSVFYVSLSTLTLLSTLVPVVPLFQTAISPMNSAAIARGTPTTTTSTSLDSVIIHDEKRNKDLDLKVTYPTGIKGTLPVIIFSHGAGGNKRSYAYLIDYWAKHGYICIQPTHDDSIGTVTDPRAAFQKLQEVIQKIPTDYQGWLNRTKDISLIIDSLPQIQSRLPEGVVMNNKAIGLGGHSYGAYTSVIVGGASVPKKAASVITDGSDKRVKAIMPISPQPVRVHGEFGFDDNKAWHNIHEPAFYMTGTRDDTGWTKAKDRRQAYEGSPAGDKYMVVIDGANHMTFSGRIPNRRPRHMGEMPQMKAELGEDTVNTAARLRIQERIRNRMLDKQSVADRLSAAFGKEETGDHQKLLQAIEQASTPFWDAYLKGDVAAKQQLKDGSLTKANKLIKIESK